MTKYVDWQWQYNNSLHYERIEKKKYNNNNATDQKNVKKIDDSIIFV